MPVSNFTRSFLFLFSVFCLSFLSQTQAVEAQAVNLILNPSLEAAGTIGVPQNWNKEGWGTPAGVYKYPDIGRSGFDKAGTVSLSANSTGDVRFSHAPVIVTAGESLTYSNWYKSDVATEIDTEFIDATGKVTYGYVTSVPSSVGVWKQITATIKIPASVTKVKVFHLLYDKGTLTVDDFLLTKVGVVGGGWNEGMVSVTFDDAWASGYTVALPILQTAGFKGTFYITTEPVQGGWDDFMTPTQVKDLAIKGHEIGGHTVTHADLPTLPDAEITKEIVNSKQYLESLIGKTVSTLAYPYGELNEKVKTLTQAAGYTTGRGVEYDVLNTAQTDKFNLKSDCIEKNTTWDSIKKSIDDAKSKKQWYIICIHEVKNNGDQYSITPAQFQQIVTYLKTSNTKVATIKEGTALMAN